MGKKYIVELGRCERLYKAYIDGNGKPELTWLSPEVDLTPYTEPDLEQIRKEAFEEGYKEGMQLSIDDAKLKEEYQQGLNDAWEAVGKIYNMCSDVRHKIFKENLIRKILSIYSASEAIEKIRQYEQGQKEIKVGDEVERILDGEVDSKAVFLEENNGYYHCLFWTGSFFTTLSYPKKQFRKTGRHFPEIAAVLEKMRGDQE